MHAISVFDSATQLYGRPFFVASVAQAVRSFGDEINNRNEPSDLSKHSEDFELYKVGEFNDSTGMFDATLPELIARGKDLKHDAQK